MRFYFPNSRRLKKAAKRLVEVIPTLSLSSAQQALAITLGYQDLHEFEQGHAYETPTPLDEKLSESEFRMRLFAVCQQLASVLGIPDGDAQYALSALRLTGDRPLSFSDHEAIRTMCWRAGPMPWAGNRRPGSTFYIKEKRYPLQRAYLRRIEGGVSCITDGADSSLCATFEAVAPRTRIEDFVPRRLVLPYGWWSLKDGSRVIFSRDYNPLWRIVENQRPQRMEPWIWVTEIKDQRWYAKETGKGWDSEVTRGMAMSDLQANGVRGLPKLVDALPIMIERNTYINGAVEQMKVVQQVPR